MENPTFNLLWMENPLETGEWMEHAGKMLVITMQNAIWMAIWMGIKPLLMMVELGKQWKMVL